MAMSNNFFLVFLISAVDANVFMVTTEIAPSAISPGESATLSVSCTVTPNVYIPGGHVPAGSALLRAQSLTELRIAYNGTPVAEVTPNKAAHALVPRADYSVQGNIMALKLGVTKPSAADIGSYSCQLAGVDTSGAAVSAAPARTVARAPPSPARLAELIDDLTQTIKNNAAKIVAQQNQINLQGNTIKSQEQKIDALQHDVSKLEQKVVFMAYHSNGSINLAENDTLVFDKTEVNIGQAYNLSSGEFSAPVAGVYQLSVHVRCNHAFDRLELTLNCNGKSVFAVHALCNKGEDNASGNTGTVQLATGDVCRVQAASGVFDHPSDAPDNTFSGFLIATQ